MHDFNKEKPGKYVDSVTYGCGENALNTFGTSLSNSIIHDMESDAVFN